MNTIKFKRKSKRTKNKLQDGAQNPNQDPTGPNGAQPPKKGKGKITDISSRYRFKRATQVLKEMDASLAGKMEDLRLLPISAKEDNIGSFFFDELEYVRMSESSNKFYELYLEIIDLSQTLPLILVNKKHLAEKCIEKLDDVYFLPIVSRLLVALLRDCGDQLFEEFLEVILPGIAARLDVTRVQLVQESFKIVAAGLKFMIKSCLKKFERFCGVFVRHFAGDGNPFLRRFSTECVVYLIKKIRNVDLLKRKFGVLFGKGLEIDIILHNRQKKSQKRRKGQRGFKEDSEGIEGKIEAEGDDGMAVEGVADQEEGAPSPEDADDGPEDADDGSKMAEEEEDENDKNQPKGRNEEILKQVREDFSSCLLFEVIKGDQGYLNEQARTLAPLIANFLTDEALSKVTTKALNLLTEQEFRFFFVKQKKNEVSHQDGYRYKFIDFLEDLYQASQLKSSKETKGQLIDQILLILSQILVFKNGARFDQKFENVAEKCLKASGLTRDSIKFIATFINIKKSGLKALADLAESRPLRTNEITLFVRYLNGAWRGEEQKVRKGFKKEIASKKQKKKFELIEDNSIPMNCFEFVIVIFMRFIEAQGAQGFFNSNSNLWILGAFFNLFDACMKGKKLQFGKELLREALDCLKNENIGSENLESRFWKQLCLLRFLRYSTVEKVNRGFFAKILDKIEAKIALYRGLLEKELQKLDDFGDEENKDVSRVKSELESYYGGDFLEKSRDRLITKNGCLESHLDALSYLYCEAINSFVAHLSVRRVKKDSKILETLKDIYLEFKQLFDLRNTNHVVLSTLWRILATIKALTTSTQKSLKDVIIFTKSKQNEAKFVQDAQFSSKLIKSAQSRSPSIRTKIFKILKILQVLEADSPILASLQLINSKEASFDTEKDFEIEIENLERVFTKSPQGVSKLEIELLGFSLIGFSSIRMRTVHDAIKNLLEAYSNFSVKGVTSEVVNQLRSLILENLMLRNIFDKEHNWFGFESVENRFFEGNGSDIADDEAEVALDYAELFQSCYKVKYDVLDNRTHLMRIFELIPAVLGSSSSKRDRKGSKGRNQDHDQEIEDSDAVDDEDEEETESEEEGDEEGSGMQEEGSSEDDDQSGESEESSEDSNSAQEAKKVKDTKKQSGASRRQKVESLKVFNQKVFNFFSIFLKNEVIRSVLPSLQNRTDKLTLDQHNELESKSPDQGNKEQQQEASFTASMLNQLIERLDKSKQTFNHQLRDSTIKRIYKFIRIFSVMKKLPSSGFQEPLYRILTEILKFPDAENQSNTLECIKRLKIEDKIVHQTIPLLKDLVKKEKFKATLLQFKRQIEGYGEMERSTIMPLANAVLYRRLVDKKGTGNYKNFASIQNFVLNVISKFRDDEIGDLMQTMFGYFKADVAKKDSIDIKFIVLEIGFNKLIGLINTLKIVLKNLRVKVFGYFDFLQTFLLKILDFCYQFENYFESVHLAQSVPKSAKNQNKSTKIDQGNQDQDQDRLRSIRRLKMYQKKELNLEDQLLKILDKHVKNTRQAAIGCIKSIYAEFIELDFMEFTQRFVSITQHKLDKVSSSSYQKLPNLLKIFGCWSEAEMYKIFFMEHPDVFKCIVSFLRSPKITMEVFDYVTVMLRRLATFTLTQKNVEEFDVASRVADWLEPGQKLSIAPSSLHSQDGGEGEAGEHSFERTRQDDFLFSALGVKLIKANLPLILDSFSEFVHNFTQRRKLVSLSRGQKRQIELKMIEFSMFISTFCELDLSLNQRPKDADSKSSSNDSQKSTQKFIKIISTFWDVNKFNKLSNKPKRFIRTAEELLNYQREVDKQMGLLGLMVNLTSKASDLETLYFETVLPFIAKLGQVSLRVFFKDLLLAVVQNPNFAILGLEPHMVVEIANLFTLERSIGDPDYDYNRIVDFLIKIANNFGKLNKATKLLIAVVCVGFSACQDLSTRTKSLEILKAFIEDLEPTKKSLLLYKKLVIDTAIYFLQSHFGAEHMLKSCFSVLEMNLSLYERVKGLTDFQLPYTDLGGLEETLSAKKKKKKKSGAQLTSFFDRILNLKIVERMRAMRVVTSKIDSKGKKFEAKTIREVFIPLLEYFAYDQWFDVNKPSNAYSKARIDRVQNMLDDAFTLYGKVVNMLSFSQFIKQLRAIIDCFGRPFKPKDTILRLVCSCLEYIRKDGDDVVEILKKQCTSQSDDFRQKSVMNQILSTFSDDKRIMKARLVGGEEAAEGEVDDFDGDEVRVKALAATDEDLMQIEAQGGREADPETSPCVQMTPSQLKILRNKILVPLKRNLTSKTQNQKSGQDMIEVHSQIALAIIKLIRIFPLEIFNNELIGVISKIAKCLKEKNIKTRDEARGTLCQIIQDLGPYFLGFVVKELAFQLNRGFEIHVRNYTIYKLLDSLVNGKKISADQAQNAIEGGEDAREVNDGSANGNQQKGGGELDSGEGKKLITAGGFVAYGDLDYCVSEISKLLLSEIAGQLASEKEANEIRARTKEFRKNKGVESFKLLARCIDFSSNAVGDIINNVEELFVKKDLASAVKKFDILFDELIQGFKHNLTFTQESLFLWVITTNKRAIQSLNPKTFEADSEMIPERKMNVHELKRNNMKRTYEIQEGAAEGKSIFQAIAQKRDIKTAPFGRVLAVFAMKLFLRKIKMPTMRFNFEDEEEKQRLTEYMDPLVDQLIEFMNSDISKLIHSSLLIVSYVINWPVFTLKNKGRKLLRIILRIFEKIASSDLDLIQSSFKMIKKILVTNKKFLPNSQISKVYDLIDENLHPADFVTEPLHCLNAMITQKLFKEKLYDILDRVFTLTVKTRQESIRALTKGILLNFIENTPMSKNLLEKFFLRLINNIEFEDVGGRKVVAEMLLKFCTTFPVELYKEYIDVLLLGLVTATVNEKNFMLKQGMKGVLRTVLMKVREEELTKFEENFIKYTEMFLNGEEVAKRRAGVVLLEALFSAGIQDGRVVSKIDLVGGFMDEVNDQIKEFYLGIKEERELKEAMKNSQWKNLVMFDDAKEFLKKIKESKNLTIDCLFVISAFINGGALEMTQIEAYFKKILAVRNHPDEDIQMLVMELSAHFISFNELKAIAMANLKDIILMVLAALKTDNFPLATFLAKSRGLIHAVYNVFGAEVPSLKINFLKAVDQISAKSLKFYNKGRVVYHKILAVLKFLVDTQTEFAREDELDLVMRIILRLTLNGNMTQNREFIEQMTEVEQSLKQKCADKDLFMSLRVSIRKEIMSSKTQFKEKLKLLAINDPKKFAQLKLKKNLRKREKRKERIREMKAGTYIPQKKVKNK